MNAQLTYILVREREADLRRAALLRSARPDRPARPHGRLSRRPGRSASGARS